MSPRSLILALCSFFLLAVAIKANHHDGDSELFSYDAYEYKYFAERMTWQQAYDKCQVWGGHLATIHSEAENDFLKNKFDNFWIGLATFLTNVWSWVDKSQINFNKWKDGKTPNSANQCVDADKNGWMDKPCNEKRGFVCKRRKTDCGLCDKFDALIGAPNPQVYTEFEGNDITIIVEMGNTFDARLQYGLTFGEKEIGNYDFLEDPVKCTLKKNSIDMKDWKKESTRCMTTFTLKMPLNEYIRKTEPKIEVQKGDNAALIKNTLHMLYLDNTSKEDHNHCAQSIFNTEIDIKVVLVPDSQVKFAFEGDAEDTIAPPSFSSVTVNEFGRLVIDVLVFPTDPNFRFTDFTFHRHSKGLKFIVSSEECNCQDAAKHFGCQYRIKMVSEKVVADYSGDLVIEFEIVRGNVKSKATFSVELEYRIVNQPPILTTAITTTSSLVTENCLEKKNMFSPFERAYVLTETDTSLSIPETRLALDDVFLCCAKDHKPLDPYQPSAGKYGCTKYDDRTMSFWEQLFVKGVPSENSAVDPKIVDLGGLVTDKVALSFDPAALFGEDRLCYIHVRSAFAPDTRRRLISTDKNAKFDVIESTAAISFKSCSVFASKDSCTTNSVCEWSNKLKACTNVEGAKLEKRQTAASAAPISGISAAALVFTVCGVMAMLF